MDNFRVKIINNFVSDEDCAKAVSLVDAYEAAGKLEEFNGNEDVWVVPEADHECAAFVKKYSDRVLDEQAKFHGYLYPLYTREGWLSIWNKPGAKSMAHTDSHDGYEHLIFSSVLYLNDGYEGGEIYFPNQGYYYKPKRGDVVMFPCGGHEYLHGVKPVTGRRYTVPMFHTARPDMASPILHPGVAASVDRMPTPWYYDGWGVTDDLSTMVQL